MKKLGIGLAVFVVFLAYSLGIRHKNPILSKPSSLANSGSGSVAGTAASNTKTYKDGTYTGSVADAYYGNVQVAVTIASGKISDVKFLQYPNTHQTSVYINNQAMPYLKQEALQAQNSKVQIISGATYTSEAFQQSLESALSQA